MTFGPGDIFVFAPQVMHTFVNTEFTDPEKNKTVVYVIHFSSSCVEAHWMSIPELKSWRPFWEGTKLTIKTKSKEAITYITRLYYEKEENEVQRLVRFILLIDTLSNASFHTVNASEDKYPMMAHKNNMELIRQFLIDNYQKDIKLHTLANMSHLTKASFCRKFKMHFLKSYKEMLNEIWIEHAKNLLLRKELNISDIGFRVGYGSTSYFCEVFKKINGCSPKQHLSSLK